MPRVQREIGGLLKPLVQTYLSNTTSLGDTRRTGVPSFALEVTNFLRPPCRQDVARRQNAPRAAWQGADTPGPPEPAPTRTPARMADEDANAAGASEVTFEPGKGIKVPPAKKGFINLAAFGIQVRVQTSGVFCASIMRRRHAVSRTPRPAPPA